LLGKYLNGRLYCPAHIHFWVTAAEERELVSQIYFQGDPNIIEDPRVSKQKAQVRISPIILEDIKGGLAVNFDIYL
jgi:protocatechuate 3,4-dioxygenase beta subunit